MKPRLLDLFCCAGGAGMGYHRAGFEVVGVDINLQPRYPFEFHQADALEYVKEHWREFDVIHASPPCQRFSKSVSKVNRAKHPDYILATQDALREAGKTYVIENVRRARLNANLMLCGSMFGLRVIRHRYFECSMPPVISPVCNHFLFPADLPHAHNRTNPLRVYAVSGGWQHVEFSQIETAMGIDWMNARELSEAIPPAYTEWLGRHILESLVTA